MDDFCICYCSSLLFSVKTKAPTPFLQALTDSIDFSNRIDYDAQGEHYRLLKPLPNDSHVREIQYCLDFLVLEREKRFNYLNDKYISIWSLVYDLLGIKKFTYDYLLLNYLENKGYMQHTGNLGCGSLKNLPPWYRPSKRVRKAILAWAKG